MTAVLARPRRNAALKVVFCQSLVTVFVTVITTFGWGMPSGLSALWGGVCATFPHFVFVLFAFRYSGARSSKLVAQSFFRGQTLKLLLTAVLFTMAFKMQDAIPEPLFLSFIAALVTQWSAPVFFQLQKLG
ncbi:ATP synthase subunit I [Algicola sagamiensis]|uniref:ATP synthase subunit I n=1 Tax=Algicola sagamiensis TaxID=163869 RepID=UPI00047813C4|nr:ATP synthase subunit I [Algicola sagamiensis]